MAGNKASRLSTENEGAAEESGALIAPVRRIPSEAGARAEPPASKASAQAEAPASALGSTAGVAREQSLDALERAADGIRPSWHGTELEARAPRAELPMAAIMSGPLPPPAPLPAFASFPIGQAPQYSADSTVRTAALLPERLAHLLNHPPVARASHWLRARPWALWSLAAGTFILLLVLLWPAPEPAPLANESMAAPAGALRRAPPPPPLPSAPEPATPAAASPSPTELQPASEPAPPAPATNAKRRDKRAARAAPKAVAPKAREPKVEVRSSAREPKKAINTDPRGALREPKKANQPAR